jgi:hypothetical protein
MKKINLIMIVGLSLWLMSSAGTNQAAAEEKWISLFDGKNLDGWKQLTGKAIYKAEDGMIVGTTAGTQHDQNSFLCTEKNYGDFILELDLKISNLNSGVQIRSERNPAYEKGRVYGYQAEIDETDRAWSGGIYDEARRGWINNLLQNEAARKAFKRTDWNHYRIEAIGDSIKTWVNGVQAADLVDAMTQTGFIGLQVHSTDESGKNVYWKNIRIQDLGQHVWKPLGDVANLNGWNASGNKWQSADKATVGFTQAANPAGAVLACEKPLSNYTLRLKFKAIKGQGSFFMMSPKADSLTGLNVAIDATSAGMTGALFDGDTLLQKPYQGWESDWQWDKEDRVKPQDWNLLTVSVHGKRIVVFINNHKTAELKDYTGPAEGYPAMQVKGGRDGEIWFKDVEQLVPEKK